MKVEQKNDTSLPPAQLLIGSHHYLVRYTKELLKKQFCNNSCGTCITCQHIEKQQHHGAIWLEPEKQYTLEKLKPLFKQITFALEPGTKLFFIIQKAEFLTPACSNSLLKSVEEPPPGYHFLFLTERMQQILPTIRSRCIPHTVHSDAEERDEQFCDLFKHKLTCAPSVFLKILAQHNPNERETIEFLDHLLAHWLKKNKEQPDSQNNRTNQMVSLIKNSLQNPPMPGSSKIFWKNFYLQMKYV